MSEKIKVIQFGLGPIGCATARLVLQKKSYELVGAVDIDPAKEGKELGVILGSSRVPGIIVRDSVSALAGLEADVAIHTTASYFDLFRSQVQELLHHGLNVVSTSEELSFPWKYNKTSALELERIAQKAEKTVLGTGINPGFLMDSFPLFFSALSQQVDHVEVSRMINASLRREPFQGKIGVGLDRDEFESRMGTGRMGHVGLPESVAMLFDTLQVELVKFENEVKPVIAQQFTSSDFFEVQAGGVIGLEQTGTGYGPDGEFAKLVFKACLNLDQDGDIIKISGKPNLEMRTSGTNGDLGTAAITVNAITRIIEAAPGLMTMRDLPIVTFTP